ncbi:MAG: hypothetical protein Q9169_003379 [Polycauliona sp. 2 TL-2023]
MALTSEADWNRNYLQNPYLFMHVNLINATDEDEKKTKTQASPLCGTLVSSLHRLKDVDNFDGGFFVFGDLSAKVEGEFRLRFGLYEMIKVGKLNEVQFIKAVISDRFKGMGARPEDGEAELDLTRTVWSGKNFPGMEPSTLLSRSFGDQGVRLRIRKEPRSLLKRELASAGDSMASTHGPSHMGLQAHRAPLGAYGDQYTEEPGASYKRQRTSMDLGRNGYDAEHAHGRGYYDSRALTGLYNARDQTQTTSTANPQNNIPPSAWSSGSNLTFNHQRTDSSDASSPYTSPHTEVSGHGWLPRNVPFHHPSLNPSLRDQTFTYPPAQYNDTHLRQPASTEMSAQYRLQHNMYSRMSFNQQFTFPRTQESDGATATNYGPATRNMPLSSHYDEPSLRLRSTDRPGDMASSSRQQYPGTTSSNTLPPLAPGTSSAQSRGAQQQLLPSGVMQSIEPQDVDPGTSQSI